MSRTGKGTHPKVWARKVRRVMSGGSPNGRSLADLLSVDEETVKPPVFQKIGRTTLLSALSLSMKEHPADRGNGSKADSGQREFFP